MTVSAAIRVQMIDAASPAAAKIIGATERLSAASLRAAQASTVVYAAELQAAQAAVQGATSADELARAELKAAQAAERLAKAEIRAATEAEKMAAAQHEAAAAGQSVAQSAGTAKSGIFGVTQASKTAGYAMAGQVNAVAELAYNFGNLSPKTRGLGLAFVMAGGSAFSFAGMLGPLGVVLGVIIGLVPGVIDFFRRMGDEASGAAEEVKTFTAALDEQIAAQRRMRREHSIRDGEGSREEVEAHLVSLRAERDRAQSQGAQAMRRLSPDQRRALSVAQAGGDMSEENLTALLTERREMTGRTDGDYRTRARMEARSVLEAVAVQRRAGTFDDSAIQAQEARLRELQAEEQQEQRAELLQERTTQREVAQRRARETVSGLGLSNAELAGRLSDQAASGTFEARDLARLTPEQRATVMGAGNLSARAGQGVELAQRAVDDTVLQGVLGGGLEGQALGTGDVLDAAAQINAAGGGGAGAGAGRAELVTARGDDPTAATHRTAADTALEAARMQLRAAELAAETERRRGSGSASGPSTLGGGE